MVNPSTKLICKAIDDWVKETPQANNFGNRSVSRYNKYLFKYFIQLPDESGCRQHELAPRDWKQVKAGETLTNRKRSPCTLSIPHKAKRGVRKCVFRGDALIEIKKLQKKECPNADDKNFVFRDKQTNAPISMATSSHYWRVITERLNLEYPLHTFRSHRITQLIMGSVEPQLVVRNLGLSLSQIEKTCLRFVPAAHYNKLVQNDFSSDKKLRMLM